MDDLTKQTRRDAEILRTAREIELDGARFARARAYEHTRSLALKKVRKSHEETVDQVENHEASVSE